MENKNAVAVSATTDKLLTKDEKNIFDQVMQKIQLFQSAGELKLPQDYSPENAIKGAFLLLSEQTDKSGKSVLHACSKESISMALLKMVTEGLNPLKKQGSFVAYANKLEWVREYFGNIALAKRYGLKSITAQAIFDGDDFEFEVKEGVKTITKHEQKLENLGSLNILGAYAIYELEDGTKNTEIMNIKQIHNSWNQGYAKGGSPAHNNFPDQMAIKTVVNRACKIIINSSNDSNLMADEFETKTIDIVAEEVKNDIKTKANKETIDIDMSSDNNKTNNNINHNNTLETTKEELPEVFS